MKEISPRNLLLTVFIVLLVVFPAAAGTVTTIDFEDLSEGDGIEDFGTHYSGVTFSGGNDIGIAVVPKYNYGDYPPHSGTHVVAFHFGGESYVPTELRASFDQPVKRAGLWYTCVSNVTLEAYDESGLKIDSVNGTSNLHKTTYLEVQGSNIAYIIFHDSSNYLTCDDLTYETEDDVNIPEFPSIVLPIGAIMGLMFVFQRRKE
ncbi:hypothetical protein MSSIT_2382 [Methanosarcina siciliae T4/M]|uniref:PEF-CTERM protein sorting domain-containing protein n=2 Tax=Methanosarcina siciliae TaxID=38027 RepID=A0A0E3PEH4_9EURY|nr:PEF-CTERM sorting domain-containing protein [Methanosarcina siciliae]AKB29101.1 hypothetical protein MSSIT_2382 [Methanosarcina siciliae T4/M]AKB32999.1 hypothetical protein MSSIH_2309 [Methanosarcina siciliae HI350]